MKKFIFYIFAAGSFFFFSCNSQENHAEEKQKENTQDEKLYSGENSLTATAWFQTSAENKALYLQLYKLADLALTQNMKEKFDKPAAIISDLDETALDNSPYNARLAKEAKLYSPDSWREWVAAAKARALPGAVDFFNKAKQKGIEVFYISNRHVSGLDATIKNMKDLGFPNTKPEYYYLKTDRSDKTERRDSVMKNYHVVLYLGDNLTDFSQEFADRNSSDLGKKVVEKYKEEIGSKFIVFPNPMYGEWEKALFDNDYGKNPAEKLDAIVNKLNDAY